jgi:hypothetical protein
LKQSLLSIEIAIKDRDIRENNVNKIMFRKVPYSAWFMTLVFWSAGIFTYYILHQDLVATKSQL